MYALRTTGKKTASFTVRKPWQRRETGKEIKEYGFGIFKLMQNDGKIFTTCEEKKGGMKDGEKQDPDSGTGERNPRPD